MIALLKLQLWDVLKAVAPLVGVVCLLQALVVRAPAGLFLQFLAGSTLAVLGMMLLFTGIELGILPMGRYIGAELPRKGSLALIVGVAFGLGFATTVAEPDVLVLARQVAAVSTRGLSGQSLVYVIGLGVGLFSALALLRIVRGASMAGLLTIVYAVMLLLSVAAPTAYVPLAYDAGSVTTGVLTAPVVLALAIGFTSVLGGRSPRSDGFGLLGLASIGPIIVVLLAGILAR
jgi:hypothetical protein